MDLVHHPLLLLPLRSCHYPPLLVHLRVPLLPPPLLHFYHFHGAKNTCWTITHGHFSLVDLHLRQPASNESSRFNWSLIYHFSQWSNILSFCQRGYPSCIRRWLNTVSCHHWRDVNPGPYTQKVVQSPFETHPSFLASKWGRLIAVNSSSLIDPADL